MDVLRMWIIASVFFLGFAPNLFAFQIGNILLQHDVSTFAKEPNLFYPNPAKRVNQKTEAGILLNRKQKDNSTEVTNNNNITDVDTSSKTDILGVGFGSSMGSGVSFSLNAFRTFEEAKTETSDSNQPRKELFTNQIIKLAFNAQLLQGLTAGFAFTHAKEKAELFGSFNTGTMTTFEGSLTGITAGLFFDGQQFSLEGRYDQPLVGKANILGEDKRISEPGYIKVAGTFKSSDKLGFSVELGQTLFKQDDRRLGTTTNDANQTPISLEGLDVDQNIYEIGHLGLGVKFPFVKSLAGHLFIYRNTHQIHTDNQSFPGKEENDNTRENYALKFATHIDNNQLHLSLGMQYQLKSWSLDDSALADEGDYEAKETFLFSQLAFDL